MDDKVKYGLSGQRMDQIDDPTLLLIEKLLEEHPQENQAEIISSILIGCIKDLAGLNCKIKEENLLIFLTMLENAFKDKPAFYAHLIEEIYPTLSYRKDYHQTRLEPVVPKLQIKVLGLLIRAWNHGIGKDVEKYFFYVCDAYKNTKDQTGEIRKGIIEEFRKSLDCSESTEIVNSLTNYILFNGLPNEITFVLMKARTKIGGVRLGIKELEVIQGYQSANRSRKADNLAKAYLKMIADTENMAVELISAIVGNDHWRYHNALDNWISTDNYSIYYDFVDENTFKLTIHLRERHPNESDCPKELTSILEKRQELISKISFPPKIIIEIKGPNNFYYNDPEEK